MVKITSSKLKEKDLDRKIQDYEKKVSWPLLLAFIVIGIFAYQVIFNVIFAGVIYNPALGDIAVKRSPTQTNYTGDELKVTTWQEKGNGTLRSIEEIPTTLGIQTPLFCFVCIMVAMGLLLFNIRLYLLKQYIQLLEGEICMYN